MKPNMSKEEHIIQSSKMTGVKVDDSMEVKWYEAAGHHNQPELQVLEAHKHHSIQGKLQAGIQGQAQKVSTRGGFQDGEQHPPLGY